MLEFLNRVQLRGSEVDAFLEVREDIMKAKEELNHNTQTDSPQTGNGHSVDAHQ